eukprot:478628_1
MKLEYVCDIALHHLFTAFNILQINNDNTDKNDYALFLKYTGHTPQITNALVVLLGISDYNETQTKIKNLKGVKLDMLNHRYVWIKKYKYDIFPSKSIEISKKYIDKEKWSRIDIYKFFNDARDTFLQKQQTRNYDGMIIVISGHGSSKNTIVTTDVKLMDIPKFTNQYFAGLTMKQFPRLFFIDCCRAGQYNYKLDDECKLNDDDIKYQEETVPLCLCGSYLIKMEVIECYPSGNVRCNGCRKTYRKTSMVWHCPKKKTAIAHGNGYDLCEKCAAINIKNQNDINYKIQSCICKATLQKLSITNSIYGSGMVVCDVCSKRFTDQNAVIWNCPNGENEAHPDGYDICTNCFDSDMNTEGLLTMLYGNSPLKTVDENNKGGVFTTAALEVLGTNNGITELHELVNKMNITLRNASKQKQIVFREGGIKMDKLIIVSGSNDQTKTVDIDLKTNDNEIDEIEEQRAAVLKEAWNDHLMGKNNKLWTDSIVPYTINGDIEDKIKEIIMLSIKDFNDMTPVKWVPYESDNSKHTNWCRFVATGGWMSEEIGRKSGTGSQDIYLQCYTSKSGRKANDYWWKITIMHEMMHAIGFSHEFTRDDWSNHCKSNEQAEYSDECIKFGQYDYKSIMQYENLAAFTATNDEYARTADYGKTFSQGDLACLRRIYGKNNKGNSIVNGRAHFGEWHEACSPDCTLTSCKCGACGKLPGGLNCGYVGMNGHWTCCMNENKDSNCNLTHTGFWHMKCVDSRCTDKNCYCKSCGGGCTYEGSKAHWSCCNKEAKDSTCTYHIYV